MSVLKAAVLTISNCVIRNLTGIGIDWMPDATSTNRLAISNSLISDNGVHGIAIRPTGDVPRFVSLSRVELYKNSQYGLLADLRGAHGSVSINVSDSAASDNGFAGFGNISDNVSALTTLLVVRSTVSHNLQNGFINGQGNNNTGIGDSIVASNAFAATNGNPGFFTFGDNASYRNGTGGAPLQALGSAHAKF